jgi:putative ABC transport system ATP-binding protein
VSEATTTIVDVRKVSKSYPAGDERIAVLRGVSLEVGPGEFVAIVGPSGNGKSTLLNMITGIDRPTEGEVLVVGAPVHEMSENQLALWRGRHVGIVFQFFQLLPALSLLQNVILPMDFAKTLGARERRERAQRLMELVGLGDQAGRLPSAVSGGQQQRAAIARALANDPPLIVADEPTGNLDARTAESVFELFHQLVGQGKTLIMVTHNDELACQASRRIEIRNGVIAQDGSCHE